MPDHSKCEKQYRCFVCKKDFHQNEVHYNNKVNLPVCKACKGTDQETSIADNLLNDLADGFVCGCI